MLLAVQPHADDIPLFAAGTVAKLLDEGYTGYLITMSDDSMAGTGTSIADIELKNEKDTVEMARRLGLVDGKKWNLLWVTDFPLLEGGSPDRKKIKERYGGKD